MVLFEEYIEAEIVEDDEPPARKDVDKPWRIFQQTAEVLLIAAMVAFVFNLFIVFS